MYYPPTSPQKTMSLSLSLSSSPSPTMCGPYFILWGERRKSSRLTGTVTHSGQGDSKRRRRRRRRRRRPPQQQQQQQQQQQEKFNFRYSILNFRLSNSLMNSEYQVFFQVACCNDGNMPFLRQRISQNFPKLMGT